MTRSTNNFAAISEHARILMECSEIKAASNCLEWFSAELFMTFLYYPKVSGRESDNVVYPIGPCGGLCLH